MSCGACCYAIDVGYVSGVDGAGAPPQAAVWQPDLHDGYGGLRPPFASMRPMELEIDQLDLRYES